MVKKIFIFFILFYLSSSRFLVAAEKKKGGRPPALVAVSKVKGENIGFEINLVGSIIATQVSRVSSQTSGLVKSIKVIEGQKVIEGAALVVLENSQLLIAINEAKALLDEEKQTLFMLKNGARSEELLQKRAQAEETKILWKKKKQELQRVENLYKKKILSENEYTNILLDADALQQAYIQKNEEYLLLSAGTRAEEVAIQDARVRTKQAQLNFLLDNKKKMVIRSPFDGIVVKKFVEKGEWIDKGSQVIEVINIDPAKVEVSVNQGVVYFLKPGDNAVIEVDAIPGKTFHGKVSEIIPQASLSSRSFPVHIILENKKHLLKSGMTTRVTLSYGDKKSLVMIPQDALVITGSDTFVFTVADKTAVKKIPVKTGRSKNGWIEVEGNIKEFDLVVTKGNERLRPGQTVTVQ